MVSDRCDRLALPEGAPLHHLESSADLPDDDLMRLLFPHRQPGERAVVGFDVEWRPQGRGYATSRGSTLGGSPAVTPAVPVAVLQLSSEHATVVINATALGRSILGRPACGEHDACAAGVAPATAVFESDTVEKVGLQCDEDVRRLRQVMPECSFRNVVDIKVCIASCCARHGFHQSVVSQQRFVVCVVVGVCFAMRSARRSPSWQPP